MTSFPDQPAAISATAIAGRPLRYYDLVMAAFVAVLLLSNIIGAAKLSIVDFTPLMNALPGMAWVIPTGCVRSS